MSGKKKGKSRKRALSGTLDLGLYTIQHQFIGGRTVILKVMFPSGSLKISSR